jgi:ABC-type branched-subunit amino acid transport system ATPase component
MSVVLVEQDVVTSKKTSEFIYIMLKVAVVLSGCSKELSDD